MNNYDIVIIGAGPAGATLARLLDDQYRVLVIEKRPLDKNFKEGMFEKSCGGLISEEAQKTFAALHMAVPKSVTVDPQIFTVRTIDLKTGADNYYPKHYVNINRERFDRWLFSLINPHVKIVTDAMYKTHERNKNGGFTVEYMYKKKKYSVGARYIVSAEGALSCIRRTVSGGNAIKRYITIQDYFKTKEIVPYHTALFDNDITDFYSWTIPKDDYIILGSALAEGPDAVKKFDLLKKEALERGLVNGKPFKRTGAPVFRPLHRSDVVAGENNIFLIGEAAGLISPSSAEGFSFALRSAYHLANAFNSGKKDILALYNKGIANQKSKIARRKLKFPFMFNSFVRNLAIKSGIDSIHMLD